MITDSSSGNRWSGLRSPILTRGVVSKAVANARAVPQHLLCASRQLPVERGRQYFQANDRDSLSINVDQVARIDFTLEIGAL
jgi:hypothetical protein